MITLKRVHILLPFASKKKGVFSGDIKSGNIVLSPVGEIVHKCWNLIPNHFYNVITDVFIIMPNHLHGIVGITDDRRGVQLNAQSKRTSNIYESISPKRNTLSVIIRTFKAAVTTQSRKRKYNFFEWQRNYYEHIIRNEDELNRIREYIQNNLLQWQFDRDNPEQKKDESYDKQWGRIEDMLYPKRRAFN